MLTESWRSGFIRSQPYLLRREEISRFFQSAAELETTSPWKWQSVAFFSLMHSCGLRTCETRRLQPRDVDLGNGEIEVLWSKGNRSRRLPISGQIVDILYEKPLGQAAISGRVIEVDRQGHLVIEAEGRRHSVSVGDVSVRR